MYGIISSHFLGGRLHGNLFCIACFHLFFYGLGCKLNIDSFLLIWASDFWENDSLKVVSSSSPTCTILNKFWSLLAFPSLAIFDSLGTRGHLLTLSLTCSRCFFYGYLSTEFYFWKNCIPLCLTYWVSSFSIPKLNPCLFYLAH